MIYMDFESVLVFYFKILNSKIQMGLVLTKYQKYVAAVMVISQYVLMINLVNLLNYTYEKMLFTVTVISSMIANIRK